MKTRRHFFSLISGFCLFMSIQAQVNIGSGEAANKGAILDIKSQTADGTTNANATKGLGIPRVALTQVKQLYPMFESTPGSNTPNAEYSTNKASLDRIHTGLVVYNVTVDATTTNLLDKGLYVWDGTQWVPLNLATIGGGGGGLGSGVIEHPGVAGLHDGFLSADFGAAGHWMTTNYGGYEYDSNIYADVVKFQQGGSVSTPGGPSIITSNTHTPKWNYSAPSSAGPFQDFPFYNFLWVSANKNVYKYTGRLYSYAGAISTKYSNLYGEKGGVETPFYQGICPNGWHLPSDYEWTQLEQEMALNTKKYSTATTNGDPSSITQNATTAGTTRGLSSPFNSPPSLTENPVGGVVYAAPLGTGGTSKDPDQGGFAALATGYSLYTGSPTPLATGFSYGTESWFWTSSSTLQNTHAWARVFGATASAGVTKRVYQRIFHMAVRCKRDI